MSSKRNNNCRSNSKKVCKPSFFVESLIEWASFQKTIRSEDFSFLSQSAQDNQGQDTMEMSETLDKQLQMLEDVISNLELMELKLEDENEQNFPLNNNSQNQGGFNRIKELNKTNLRDFNDTLNNKANKNGKKQQIPKVNRSLTKILYEDDDYENISDVLSDTSDEDVITITTNLKEALNSLAEDRKKKYKLGTGNFSAVCKAS